MKRLALRASVEDGRLVTVLPPDLRFAEGETLDVTVEFPNDATPPVPKTGDGVEAWRAYFVALGPLGDDFTRPPQGEDPPRETFD